MDVAHCLHARLDQRLRVTGVISPHPDDPGATVAQDPRDSLPDSTPGGRSVRLAAVTCSWRVGRGGGWTTAINQNLAVRN